ncbi:DUF1493 family protein [Rosenbergiella epipactidis]|uniref:DUF1493 family protein n=1 Tax=Rosenbergiella epipactidis TaxID=1544694 RepID=UPI0020272BD4|nr:DUF1493 family protein [Rosenbergiella epipactidis]MCL9669383.1 DUF1493 family protein [Rosenbergiella epipactidis]
MMNQALLVKKLVKKHFWDMAGENSLSTGNNPVLPEDAAIFLEEYFNMLGVEPNGFTFQKYFPNEGIRFLPNALLPDYLKTDHHVAQALTLEMLIASAEAGCWLYGD